MKPKTTSRGRTATRAKAKKPKTPDDYLAVVSHDKRAALETLRKNIKAAAPEAEECISYGLPAFVLTENCLWPTAPPRTIRRLTTKGRWRSSNDVATQATSAM